MVQSAFETYKEFTDSVYYDASSWSIANFYNMPFSAITTVQTGEEITELKPSEFDAPEKSTYAYIMTWNEYSAPAALYYFRDL